MKLGRIMIIEAEKWGRLIEANVKLADSLVNAGEMILELRNETRRLREELRRQGKYP